MENTQDNWQSDLDFDRKSIWHPYTSMSNPLHAYPIESAKGVKLKLADGRELVDGMSSWWTAIHGYNVPELNNAASQQLKKMSHVMFGGITHKPAIDLAKKLIEITPPALEKVFLCDSGSVSVEVAMKMALQYQQAKGLVKRTKFMTFKGGYHGDTTGAMSVCDPKNGMHHLFSDFLPQHFFCKSPLLGFDQKISEEEEIEITDFFKDHVDQTAAFILEPVVQGAGGMRMYSPEYLTIISRLCKEHEVLLIADEIATGFGRTGEFFACNHADITPDIMCLGKALTGGYVSLASTLCTNEVAITISEGEAGVFMHGPTFMGNPLSCAVAVKSIELLLNSPWQKRVKAIEKQLLEELEKAAGFSSVKDVRALGAIGVIELLENINVQEAQSFFVDHGVWIRPFKNLLYIMPPYIISKDELNLLTKTMVSYCRSIKKPI